MAAREEDAAGGGGGTAAAVCVCVVCVGDDGSGLVIHTHNEGGRRPHTAQHTRQTSTKLNPPRTTGGQASYEHAASSSAQGLKRGSKQGLNRVDELRDAATSGGLACSRVEEGH